MYGNLPVNQKHLDQSAQWMREYWERREFEQARAEAFKNSWNKLTRIGNLSDLKRDAQALGITKHSV